VLLLVAAPAHAHDGLAAKLGPSPKPVNIAAVDDPAKGGSFGDPFAEPTIGGRLTGQCRSHWRVRGRRQAKIRSRRPRANPREGPL
jgi:hypothetical protein